MNLFIRCRSEAVAVPIPLDGMGRGASGIAIFHGYTKFVPVKIAVRISPY